MDQEQHRANNRHIMYWPKSECSVIILVHLEIYLKIKSDFLSKDSSCLEDDRTFIVSCQNEPVSDEFHTFSLLMIVSIMHFIAHILSWKEVDVVETIFRNLTITCLPCKRPFVKAFCLYLSDRLSHWKRQRLC